MLRKFSDWLGLNKPNKYKFIIAFIIIILNFASFVYVFSYAICVAPSCPKASTLSNMLLPLVMFTYSPFYIQNELADSILYKRTIIASKIRPDINGNIPTVKSEYPITEGYTVERKYPIPIEYTLSLIHI